MSLPDLQKRKEKTMFEMDGKLIIEWKAGGDGVELEASGLSTDILSALATALRARKSGFLPCLKNSTRTLMCS